MLLCNEDIFSDAQDIPDAVQANDSTNTLDWGSHGDDIQAMLRWSVICTNTAASDGAATLVIKWETSANDSDWTVLWTSETFAKTALVAGAKLVDGAYLPRGLLRYNKLTFTTGTAEWTTSPIVDAMILRNDMPVAY